jgi:UDP-N-acetylmuramoyl-L-alanyl-D-glutamate--2,6-diaminopimelate ligase
MTKIKNINDFLNLITLDNDILDGKKYIIKPKLISILNNYTELLEQELKEPTNDSRIANDNYSFVAIKGTNSDGHNYIKQSIENGCKVIFCEIIDEVTKALIENSRDVICILVDNTRKLLSFLSNYLFDFPSDDIDIFAVTGTNGKTTITYILRSLLYSNSIHEIGIIGTTGVFYNGKSIEATHTTPESIDLIKIIAQMKKDGIKIIVMETSSHALEQFRVANINFRGAIFTNLTLDHLDYHKTMDNYANAKKILFDNLSEDAFAVLNSDDKYSELLIRDCQAKINFVSFNNIEIVDNDKVNKNKANRYKVKTNNISTNGISFSLCEFNNINTLLEINSNLIGSFNIQNLALCLVLVKIYGVEDKLLIKRAKNIVAAKGRMETFILKSQNKQIEDNNILAVIDYAHTPDSLEKVLITLREIKNESQQLICIFGCGGDRDRTKRPIMGEIAYRLADITIITDDNPRSELSSDIINDIKAGINEYNSNLTTTPKIYTIPDRKEAIEKAIAIANSNDIILIAGKGHEEYQIIGKEKIYFSDENVIKKYLAN